MKRVFLFLSISYRFLIRFSKLKKTERHGSLCCHQKPMINSSRKLIEKIYGGGTQMYASISERHQFSAVKKKSKETL